MASIILKEKDFECKNWKSPYELLEQSKTNDTKVFSEIVPHLFRQYVQAKVYTRLEITQMLEPESREYGLFRLSIINTPPRVFRFFLTSENNKSVR